MAFIRNLMSSKEEESNIDISEENTPSSTEASTDTDRRKCSREEEVNNDISQESTPSSSEAPTDTDRRSFLQEEEANKDISEESPPSSSDAPTDTDRGSCSREDYVNNDISQEGTQSSSEAPTDTDRNQNMESCLKDLGLEQHYRQKLSLIEVLQIDKKTIEDQPATCKSDLPWCFLKNLMMVNVRARNVKFKSEKGSDDVDKETTEIDFDDLFGVSKSEDMVNPLDVITALFLCSDGFLQQEMALKMSLCQFSVPLLLPNCDSQQCTLMLWALRDIVKQYRPEALSESKGFTEERVVLSDLPMISFVRVGECSLSKSQILNKMLSNSQQYQDIFVHHDMECGDSPRRISNGLTEITWYLPCGNKNIDVFSQPVAVANLRGDINSFETQYSFLCQTSAAVFVFFDQLDVQCNLLSKQHHKAQIFLVGNNKNQQIVRNSLKQVCQKLGLNKNNIIIRKKDENDEQFVTCLREAVSGVISKTETKMRIEQMVDVAHELGIWVDGDAAECQTGKKYADEITAGIKDTLSFKEDQLPLHGWIWKELTSLEKEEFRLQKVGSENIETYKSDLKEQKEKLRQKQNSCNISDTMTCFINGVSLEQKEKNYFLKWMRMNLENLSRSELSQIREQYEEQMKSCKNIVKIKQLDQRLTNSSLGTEHFLREMGQIYEASRFLPETDPSRQQLDHLPALCAQLLLDGFPLELVDGDASNIPLQWVSDVLSELNHMVSPKNKILVLTVLGVQSTGKSTLLNTMFGVQFAVSSGRCTRGAFMLLIRVHEELQGDLNCDFIVVIDTEGLKSPELAQLDNSYEHDNELATLVVGLSDLTLVNISMENLTEMKDILQIVVHAFLRMKEVGKKPRCHFVHQNVSDVSANKKNLRDRKLLLQQLNEMTQAAARMEKKDKYKSFTDVMEYDPDTGNCYIPGLWNGNPPMAPVNAGYSEAVYELKRNIIQLLGRCNSSGNDILSFKEWMRSLWNAVKHENFIFSFRNSLVAEAYMRLCTEFNKWEWEFKKEMYTWGTDAETRILNFGSVAAGSPTTGMDELLSCLKSEANNALCKQEDKLLENLRMYFKQTEGHVYLVEGHRAEFENSAKSLCQELECSVLYRLSVAAQIRQGMVEIEQIKENHTKEIEKAVCALIEDCRKYNLQISDEELDSEFNKMWNQTLTKLSFSEQKPSDIFNKVFVCLRANLSNKGSHVNELLSQSRLQDYGQEPFEYKPEGFLRKLADKVNKWFVNVRDQISALQQKADSIIEVCKIFISEKMVKTSDYHDAYTEEMLNIIDEHLQTEHEIKTDTEFEVQLKLHICGFAAKDFQEMHQRFLQDNDPYRCLMKNKDKFCADFKDVFHQRDQRQKKATEFVDQCLKPALEDRVNRVLGLNITDEMLKCEEFGTRIYFQYSILKDLLSRNSFHGYNSYTTQYENYAKDWIMDQIQQHFSSSSKLSEFEDQLLESSISSIKDAIQKALKKVNNNNLKSFVEDVCHELSAQLVISQDSLSAFLILNNADHKQFADSLEKSLKYLKQDLSDKFKTSTIQTKLTNLHVKPQDEIFLRVIGCGKQCPFCRVPCEAGGKAHTEHWASLHRPQGLGRYSRDDTEQLVTDICSSLVSSDQCFLCHQTEEKSHPYKSYREIFPDWKISPDVSLEASDYWKYVMTKYNKEFAKQYNAKPAEIPQAWKKLTETQAIESLKESFGLQDQTSTPQK